MSAEARNTPPLGQLRAIRITLDRRDEVFTNVEAAADFCRRVLENADTAEHSAREFTLRIGSALLQIRPQIPHGQWSLFLTRIGGNKHTMGAAMRLAAEFADETGNLAVQKIAQLAGCPAEMVRKMSLRDLTELRIRSRQAVIRPTPLESNALRATHLDKNMGAGSPMIPGVGGNAAALRMAGGVDADEIIDDWEDEDLAEDVGSYADDDGDEFADVDEDRDVAVIGATDGALAIDDAPQAGPPNRLCHTDLCKPDLETSDAPEVMDAWEKKLGLKENGGVGRRGDVAGQMTLGALYEEAGLMLDRVRARLRMLSGDDLRALMGAISRFDGFSPETTHGLMRPGRIAGPAASTMPQGVTP
jgi:hypothetical protein